MHSRAHIGLRHLRVLALLAVVVLAQAWALWHDAGDESHDTGDACHWCLHLGKLESAVPATAGTSPVASVHTAVPAASLPASPIARAYRPPARAPPHASSI